MDSRCLTSKEHEILKESLECKEKYHVLTPAIQEKINEIKKWIDEIKCA